MADRSGASFLAMVTSVVFCGIIGGFVSSQRRMQSIPIDGDPLISVFGLDNSGYYLWLSPMLGAIFAVVLMLLFVSGTLQGTVFPAFATSTDASFFGAIKEALPVSAIEYAKLFSWSFLAGFAERLVPDSLDRLAMKLSNSGPGTPSPTSIVAADRGHPIPGQPVQPGQPDAKGAPVADRTIEDALHSGEPEEEVVGKP